VTRRTLWGGILLGAGLGGFVDGILLHQILQWHHMLSSTERWPLTTEHGLKVNTLADGLFHAAMWIVVFAGLALIRDRVPPRRVLYGLILVGWGAFNTVEGIVDHELLGIDHVRSGRPPRLRLGVPRDPRSTDPAGLAARASESNGALTLVRSVPAFDVSSLSQGSM
jgi:uncharacterized membrane protein